MHTVRALLVPDDVDLPDSAAPRGPNEQGADVHAKTDVEAITTRDLPSTRYSCLRTNRLLYKRFEFCTERAFDVCTFREIPV